VRLPGEQREAVYDFCLVSRSSASTIRFAELRIVEFHRYGVAEVDLLAGCAAKMAHATHLLEVSYSHALGPPAGNFDADVGLFGGEDGRIDHGGDAAWRSRRHAPDRNPG
jgi:hypothetical protein